MIRRLLAFAVFAVISVDASAMSRPKHMPVPRPRPTDDACATAPATPPLAMPLTDALALASMNAMPADLPAIKQAIELVRKGKPSEATEIEKKSIRDQRRKSSSNGSSCVPSTPTLISIAMRLSSVTILDGRASLCCAGARRERCGRSGATPRPCAASWAGTRPARRAASRSLACCSPKGIAVGECEHLRRHFETERLRGLQVDYELEFGRLLHRQVGRPCAFENAANINADFIAEADADEP
jgi:hypothetical protein